MDKVQKHNSFNTNAPSSESYRNYNSFVFTYAAEQWFKSRIIPSLQDCLLVINVYRHDKAVLVRSTDFSLYCTFTF
jgi:hypothetical protein